jgi:hypothetical protein
LVKRSVGQKVKTLAPASNGLPVLVMVYVKRKMFNCYLDELEHDLEVGFEGPGVQET